LRTPERLGLHDALSDLAEDLCHRVSRMLNDYRLAEVTTSADLLDKRDFT
jgi:hypothetical protein